MAIPDKYSSKYMFHFTHIENLESIMKHGLLCTNKKKEIGLKHFDVASETIQERRSKTKVTCGPKGVVHDYVPFYFTSNCPMFLSMLNTKNVDQQYVVFLAIPISKILETSVVYTDAAANTITPPNFYDDPKDLEKLSWKLIESRKWGYTDSDRQLKMAEVLIHGSVPIEDIDIIITWNNSCKDKIADIFKKNGVKSPKIVLDNSTKLDGYRFYYTKFLLKDSKGKARSDESLITGPKFLYEFFNNAITEVKRERSKKKRASYLFKDIPHGLKEIAKDFTKIKEMEGIYDLETDNLMHKENVSDHTLRVVEELENIDEYKKLKTETQNVLKLSAYLHDIGKGPKSMWKDEIQCAYPDHPADAAPMLKRILVEDFENINDEDIELICKLVIYHDLIGEIIGKGRNIEQLVKIIDTKTELNLLAILNLADVSAISTIFKKKYLSGIDDLKTETLKLKGI